MYHKLIIEHDRTPFHYEKREKADVIIEAYNPLCGDKFKLFLDLEGQQVKSAHFHGYGCAISKASTSILIKNLEGLNIEEALSLCNKFFEQIKGETQVTHDPDFEAFAEVKKFPGRMKCVTLSWEAFAKNIDYREEQS